MRIIDAHQHFWNPEAGDYAWLSGRYAPIRRVFGPDDLRPELRAAGVDATILVQTWSSLEETRHFLHLAEKIDFIAGVVGWVDLTALKAAPGGQRLVGIRHQVHDEADSEWLARADVRRGLAAVARHGLAYDLLVRPRELPAALSAVSDLPELRFVIDHIGKPDILGGGFAAWASLLRPFATHREHVWCKLSGMVTEADWDHWRPSDLAPYVDETLLIFGPDRCVYGSDWPVCRVAGGYGAALGALKQCLAGLTPANQSSVLAGAAQTLYHLDTRKTSL